MESIFIILFAGLSIVFLILWLISQSKTEVNERMINSLRSIDDAMNRLAFSITELRESAKTDESASSEEETMSLTKESVCKALRYNHLVIDKLDPNEPDIVRFSYDQVHYRINTVNLPYLSMEAGFRYDSQEDDIDLMRQVAEDITYNMYIAKVIVSTKGYYVFQVDFLAQSFLPLRDNLRCYLDIIIEANHRFNDRYNQLLKERKRASQDALQATLLTAPTDAAGNKILS